MKMLVKYKKAAARALFLSTFLSVTALQGEGYSSLPGKKVDFLSSMEWDAPKNKQFRDQYFSTDNTAMKTMILLKALYDKNNYFEREVVFEAKIPKIIHQIWLGPKTPPAVFKQSQESLKRLHPEWEYRLWTDADVDSITLHNQKFYNLSDNFAEKADILRYEILHQIGGVYVDVDFICFKPFDILCQYDVWAALELLDCSHGTGVNNAIIGSIPNHALLKHCIESVQQSWYTGSNLFERVGPDHFKESFVKHIQENPENNVIAFPKSFFYPLDFHQGMTHLKQNMDFNTIYHFMQPESFAMHLWAGSWRNEPSIKSNTTPLSKKKKKKKKKQKGHQKELERKKAALQEKEEKLKEEERRRKKLSMTKKSSSRHAEFEASDRKKSERKKAALQEKEEHRREKERRSKNFSMTKKSSSRHAEFEASDRKKSERKKAALQEKEEHRREKERRRKKFYTTKKSSSRYARFGAFGQWSKASSRRR